MEIIVIIVLILLNGLFSMSEIAIISARKPKLNIEIKKGSSSAKTALDLAENPNSFLSTVQVGITLIGILTGIYSGSVLASDFSVFLTKAGVSQEYSYSLAQTLIIVVVTYFTIIFGELVPKKIGLSFAETIAKIVAKPMIVLARIVYPFVWLLSKSTSFIFNLLGFKDNDAIITEEEIKAMIQESKEDGEIQDIEQNIVERVFGLGDRTLQSIMKHRSEIIFINTNIQYDNFIKTIESNPYNKYPVIDKNTDTIEGIIFIRDIVGSINNTNFSVRNYLQPVVYFPETMKVYSALEEMKNKNIDQVFIIDEYGSLQGLVSYIEIMDALVGSLYTNHESYEIIQRKDGSFLIDAQISFYDFLKYFDGEELFVEYSYNTLGGLILDLLKKIPKTGDTVDWNNFSFEIVDMDGQRIDKILVLKKELNFSNKHLS